jgi:hypothetical protein
MTIKEIIDFLKTDIKGLIILGIFTSIVAAIIYDHSKKQISRLSLYIRKKFHLNKIKKVLINYGRGFAAGYANRSSYMQIVLVGDFIIKIVLQIGWILFSLLIFIALLLLVGQPFSWIFVIIFSSLLTLQYRKLKEHKELYQTTVEQVFGDDFFENQKKSIKDYLDNDLKNKSSKPSEKEMGQ